MEGSTSSDDSSGEELGLDSCGPKSHYNVFKGFHLPGKYKTSKDEEQHQGEVSHNEEIGDETNETVTAAIPTGADTGGAMPMDEIAEPIHEVVVTDERKNIIDESVTADEKEATELDSSKPLADGTETSNNQPEGQLEDQYVSPLDSGQNKAAKPAKLSADRLKFFEELECGQSTKPSLDETWLQDYTMIDAPITTKHVNVSERVGTVSCKGSSPSSGSTQTPNIHVEKIKSENTDPAECTNTGEISRNNGSGHPEGDNVTHDVDSDTPSEESTQVDFGEAPKYRGDMVKENEDEEEDEFVDCIEPETVSTHVAPDETIENKKRVLNLSEHIGNEHDMMRTTIIEKKLNKEKQADESFVVLWSGTGRGFESKGSSINSDVIGPNASIQNASDVLSESECSVHQQQKTTAEDESIKLSEAGDTHVSKGHANLKSVAAVESDEVIAVLPTPDIAKEKKELPNDDKDNESSMPVKTEPVLQEQGPLKLIKEDGSSNTVNDMTSGSLTPEAKPKETVIVQSDASDKSTKDTKTEMDEHRPPTPPPKSMVVRQELESMHISLNIDPFPQPEIMPSNMDEPSTIHISEELQDAAKTIHGTPAQAPSSNQTQPQPFQYQNYPQGYLQLMRPQMGYRFMPYMQPFAQDGQYRQQHHPQYPYQFAYRGIRPSYGGYPGAPPSYLHQQGQQTPGNIPYGAPMTPARPTIPAQTKPIDKLSPASEPKSTAHQLGVHPKQSTGHEQKAEKGKNADNPNVSAAHGIQGEQRPTHLQDKSPLKTETREQSKRSLSPSVGDKGDLRRSTTPNKQDLTKAQPKPSVSAKKTAQKPTEKRQTHGARKPASKATGKPKIDTPKQQKKTDANVPNKTVEIKVEEVKVPVEEPCVVFLKGISLEPGMTTFCLYLEASTGKTVTEENLTFNFEKTSVVVKMTSKPDMDKMRKYIASKEIGGRHPDAALLDPPVSIAVSCEEPLPGLETLELYFDKIGDGVVFDKARESDDGSCVILQFEDSSGVQTVLKTKSHVVEHKQLRVSAVYSCEFGEIWDTCLHKVIIPEPVSHKVKAIYIKLLQRACCKELCDQLELAHCKVEFDETYLLLHCTLQPSLQRFKELKSTWKPTVIELVSDYVSNNLEETVIEWIEEDIWDDIKEFCDSNCMENEHVLLEFGEYEIQVAGIRGHVDGVLQPIREELKKLQKELKRTEKILRLHPLQMMLFKRSGYFHDRQDNLDLQVTVEGNNVVIKGQPENISGEQLRFCELKDKIETVVFEHGLSRRCVELAKYKQDIKDKIHASFEEKGIDIEWQLKSDSVEACYIQRSKGDEAMSESLYANTTQKEYEVQQVFLGMLVDKRRQYTAEETTEQNTEGWEKLEIDLTEAYDRFACWHWDDSTLEMHVYGMKTYVEIIEKLFADYLEANCKLEKTLKMGTIEVKFITRHMKSLISDIENELTQQKVSIRLSGDFALVKGTKEGMLKAQVKLENVCKTIIHENHRIEKVAVSDVYLGERRTGKIDDIESKSGCIVQLPGEEETYQAVHTNDVPEPPPRGATGGARPRTTSHIQSGDRAKPLEFKTKHGGITISLVKGEIGKQKADVVVATTAPNLDLTSGGAGKSLLGEAGNQLQQELQSNHKEDIKCGTIVTGRGYKAKFKRVYITALPSWKDKNAKHVAQKFLLDCLKLADKYKSESIIFCAIGCGQLQYPVSVVASLMFQTVIEFDEEHPQSTLKTVKFVLYQRDYKIIKVFEEEMRLRIDGGGERKVYEVKKGIVNIQLAISDLAKETVDALVCTTSPTYDMHHGACRALLCVAGKALEEECKTRSATPITEGQVVEVTPGNLPIKQLLLTILPTYSEGAEQDLKNIMMTCLKQAEAKGFQSIAFPALGAGNLKYPKDIVSNVMFDTAYEWGRQNPAPKSLFTIRFVLRPEDNDVIEFFKANIKRGATYGSRKNRFLEESGNFPKPVPQPRRPEPAPRSSIVQDGVAVHGISLQVVTGNIVEHKTTQSICVSVGNDFELFGALAKSLLTKCPDIRKETKQHVKALHKDGVVMINEDKLPAKRIIFIQYKDTLPGWTDNIKKCFQLAENNGVQSVALPVLGTGQGNRTFPPSEIAGAMYDALNQFGASGYTHLRHVHIVVFPAQKSSFFGPIKDALEVKSKGATPGMFSGLLKKGANYMYSKLYVMPWKNEDAVIARDIKEEKKKKSSITLVIHSNSKQNIDNCRKELDLHFDEAYNKDVISAYKEVLTSLTVEERRSIDDHVYLVDTKLDEQAGVITVEGPRQNVFDAKTDIEKVLRQIKKDRLEKEEAAKFKEFAMWHFESIEDNGESKLKEYGELISYRIEMAYVDGKKNFQMPAKDKVYEINFATLDEYPVDNPSDKVKVFRKEVLKDKNVVFPKNWATMKDDENFTKKPVKNDDPEYKRIEKKFLDEVKGGQYKDRVGFSFDATKLTVATIERVQNKTLYAQYQTKKVQMESRPNQPKGLPVERELWHGTNVNALDSIIQHGFNRSYAGDNTGKKCWYGDGVYFAGDASYSVRGWMTTGGVGAVAPGTKLKLFLAKVLTGQFTKGAKDMRVPPPIDPKVPLVKYDSTVDDVNKPYEFCIFHDTQAYPEYVITFQVN